ncbi:Carbonic anhydrase or acetyltransferase, isoleucine patch superfamily [Desulfofundulus australicus DSM 11792]|uniref:Carbonic anhydrase or acetyltransferase, isoleucine patch superfamily n=1 Tax=Desulfofundulus australicus DSM 11792 TaxID=1121425 RepID=A0A1M4USX1_9FIRM|nr:gamma carbonic anhydrase family protein [Desulfofundulus australicus]SHE59779.1 Carbonic anhydrase or acetyltransferase, isoleucine patch superfamily [Desulfofundulus australicus DSM 11792]
MGIYEFKGFKPQLAEDVFIAPGARIIGRVEIGRNSSVWFNTVIRGDADRVTIGEETNIQDGCQLHEDPGYPLKIGNRVTVGHGAILHGCTIEDGSLIGMGAIILNGARIGKGSVVGAGALVVEGQEIPPGCLALGSPARVIRQISAQEMEKLEKLALIYRQRAGDYRLNLSSSSSP